MIIKKDNGKYAVWSTVVDDFLINDASKEEIITTLTQWNNEDFQRHLEQTFNRIDRYQRRDYQELEKTRERIHGRKNSI